MMTTTTSPKEIYDLLSNDSSKNCYLRLHEVAKYIFENHYKDFEENTDTNTLDAESSINILIQLCNNLKSDLYDILIFSSSLQQFNEARNIDQMHILIKNFLRHTKNFVVVIKKTTTKLNCKKDKIYAYVFC